jgi:hypothetical protein
MNLGLTGDGDRALGSYPRTTPSGDQVFQVAVVNTTGAPLSSVVISYAGEQWNQAQGTSTSGPEMIRVLASSTSTTTGFDYYASLDFTAPNQGPGVPNPSALDGNGNSFSPGRRVGESPSKSAFARGVSRNPGRLIARQIRNIILQSDSELL